MPTKKEAALITVAGALCLLALLFAQSASQLVADESVHVPQIRWFLQGRFDAHPLLTTIPGYHLLVAVVLKVLAMDSIAAMRAIGLGLGIVAALVFFFIRRKVGDPRPCSSALLLLFLPFLFPYYFLVYTDVLSLLFVLCALLATLQRRHVLAAFALTLAICVRQNNVVWAGFMPLFALWPTLKEAQWRPWHCAATVSRVAWPYLLPVVAFLAYWAWNGTISLSKTVAAGHPDLRLHVGNLYFSLFLFFVFFPNDIWKGLQRFAAAVRRNPWWLLVPLALLALVKLKGSYDNTQFTDYFIRNWVIETVRHGGWERWAFAAVVALSACSIAFVRFTLPQAWLVYPFSILYLASSWLVENRYSIIPFAL
ncbi:hypothetical protein ACTJIL_15915 [Luteimonas sp. 22616]|uniref:hypothetical protein n=1 Tax=Luteimonas sp. 22616 TaxID=3453951 RepID=UPI003F826BF5